MTTRRYPIEPLAELTRLSISQLCRRHGISGTTAQAGLTADLADRVCIAHDLHPYNVWPDMADHHLADQQRTCADERCAATFTPEAARQRYCDDRCRVRRQKRDWYRRRYQSDADWRATQVDRVSRYQDEIGREAVNAAERRRYHRDAEARRAARRERYHRTKETAA